MDYWTFQLTMAEYCKHLERRGFFFRNKSRRTQLALPFIFTLPSYLLSRQEKTTTTTHWVREKIHNSKRWQLEVINLVNFPHFQTVTEMSKVSLRRSISLHFATLRCVLVVPLPALPLSSSHRLLGSTTDPLGRSLKWRWLINTH